MSVLLRIILALAGVAALLALGAALAAITGLERGWAELVVAGVFAAIALPMRALSR